MAASDHFDRQLAGNRLALRLYYFWWLLLGPGAKR